MEKTDWKDIASKLTMLLKLHYTPIGMKWIEKEDELMSIPKVRIHDKHLPPCAIANHAAQNNWTSACKAENIHADYCRTINGMHEADDKYYSGEMFKGFWFGNIEASKGHNEALECIPPKYCAVVASPLTSGRIEPDVCVFYVTPGQAFMLLAGCQYDSYEKIDLSFVGESTCSDSWCKTFRTGKPGLGLPCYADTKFGGMGDGYVRVTLAPSDVLKAVEGMSNMSKNGLRYPIASYSLTSDILEGMPEHYLKF